MEEKKRVRAERFGIITAQMVVEKEPAMLADWVRVLRPQIYLYLTN